MRAHATTNRPAMRWTLAEFAGGLGDLGTFLPLALAMAIGCGMDLGLIFILAGAMNIATGLIFNQPIPVQPMKSMAAVALASGLGATPVLLAGVMIGAILLGLSAWPGLNRALNRIPPLVVAAIQAGVGMKLAWLGLLWIAELPWHGVDSLPMAALLLVLLAALAVRCVWLLPVVVGLGLLWAGLQSHATAETSSIAHPINALSFAWLQSPLGAWGYSTVSLTLPQLPLTLTNSVVAVCALSALYFPGRGISPRQMTASVGLMNLLACPLGGIPMCHGSGGLAAQYHFGARTGAGVVMLGAMKIALVLVAWPWLPAWVGAFPIAILAPLLIIAGLQLSRASSIFWRQPAVLAILLVCAVILWQGMIWSIPILLIMARWPRPNRGAHQAMNHHVARLRPSVLIAPASSARLR